MRPIRLAMEGFAAFRDPTVVDFEGVELFALVGPTGAGKSTVIDAICFALYGSVPRYGDKKLVAPVISLGALEAKVSLTFAVGAQRYVATRVVRRVRSGGASTREARLERSSDGAVLAGSAREIDPAVEAIVGLGFDHFTRSVVLPQGEFARFLHDRPADRQELLVRLLDLGVYERMRQRAAELAARHDATIAGHRVRLTDLADATTDQLTTWTEWVGEYAAYRDELRAAKPALGAAESAVVAARDRALAARELAELLAAVHVPEAVLALADERATAEARLTTARAAAEVAIAAVTARAHTVGALPPRDELAGAQRAHAERGEVEAALAASRAAHEDATAEEQKAAAAVSDAEAGLVAAEAARDELRVAHAAHALTRTLRADEPCPVCDQPVAVVPKRRAPGALRTADTALTRAKATLEKARAAQQSAGRAVAAAQQSVRHTTARVASLTKQVRRHPDPAGVERALGEVDAATRALEQARTAEAEARAAERDARVALEHTADRMQRATRAYRGQRDPILAHPVAPPGETDVLVDDWRALAAWAAEHVAVQQRAARDADETATARQRERDQRLAALAEGAAALELAVPRGAGVDELIELAIKAHAGAEHEVKRINAALGEVATLRAEVEAAEAEIGVARELARLLRSDQFERWLVAEALDRLVAGASERLHELSDGHYALAFDESLLVVDHRNADERRSVKTLSGGETFQASLALALALADQLADLGAGGPATLESIFLDEGFGSLDADTLDTAAAAIERLGTGDRMVGVVTHVADFAQRLPVRYVVTAGPPSAAVHREAS